MDQTQTVTVARWSQLPQELLNEIANHLDTQFDNLRFRSICTSWRSSVSPRPLRFRGRSPILPNDGISDTTWGFFLSKRTVFLIVLPQPENEPEKRHLHAWFVKIGEDSHQRYHLYNPLSKDQFGPLPTNFPKVLDLWGLRVFELAEEYVLQYINYRPLANSLMDAGNMYLEKVVFMSLGKERNDFALLTIHVSGKLAMFRSGDRRWTIIQEMPSPYDDVIVYKGKFYAVDNTGRTVVLDLSARLKLFAKPVFGGDKKFLVKSHGELLLVDMYLSFDADGDQGSSEDEFIEQFDYCMRERTVRFKVFRLNEGEQEWVEVNNLDDGVLFLGDDCTFFASVANVSGVKGNCILFADNYFHLRGGEDGELKGLDVGVYDMESGSIEPLEFYPGYAKLFWPPPDWVCSTQAMTEVQNHLEELTL